MAQSPRCSSVGDIEWMVDGLGVGDLAKMWSWEQVTAGIAPRRPCRDTD